MIKGISHEGQVLTSKGYRVLAATDDECNVADQEELVMEMTKPSEIRNRVGLSSDKG